ncbi:MAG TPA: glycosyltransferase family 9 protein [Flavitalea sp.]|nr:glycosyltransferase family 9 protein [Flavitalea sp.]
MNSLEKPRNFRETVPPSLVKSSKDSRSNVKRVLICRPNHRLGNLLLITPLIQEITETFPDCKIDLFVKGGIAPILFKNYQNIDRIIQLPKRPLTHLLGSLKSWLSIRKDRYDIVIDVDKRSSSGRLSLGLANSKHKISGDAIQSVQSKFANYEHHAKFPVYNLRHYLNEHGYPHKDTPIPSLNLKLDLLEIAKGKALLNQLVHNNRPTICLFTFATGNKCYSEIWWENFYERLQAEFPQHNIIEVLPVQNVSKLSFKVPTFYSKDLREIASLIANTEVFIGADSGIMHLASAAQTPTIGLFSVTDQSLYAPYNENSVAINTNLIDTDKCIRVIHSILQHKLIHQSI